MIHCHKASARLSAATFISIAGMTAAQEAPMVYLHIGGELSFEVEDDWTVNSIDQGKFSVSNINWPHLRNNGNGAKATGA